MQHISQMPVVLIPLHFDRDPVNRIPSCGRSIVLRPFITNDFMTGVPVVPGSENLPTTVKSTKNKTKLLKINKISIFICRYSQKWFEKF